jgi:hypothetical protein
MKLSNSLVQSAKQADLFALASRYTTLRRAASSGGGEYAGACPLCKAGRDRFRVQPSAHRWLCRYCTEGKWQDAIALQMKLTGAQFSEAVYALANELPPTTARPLTPTEDYTPSGPPCDEWQARARVIIAEAEENLWSATGARALAWLRARGLADATIRAARLGFISAEIYDPAELWALEGKPVYLPHGILIPCEVAGNVWYLKVRRPTGQPKYIHARGGRRALYMADTLSGASVAIFTEGEFDARLLWQEAGDVAGVVTLGSAGNRLDVATWGLYLLPVVYRLLAYDIDDAGARGAQSLDWLRNARRIAPPYAPGEKDLTDYHKGGGDLRAWLLQEVAESDSQNATGRPTSPAVEDPEHLCPALSAAMQHPQYTLGLPIAEQAEDVEEIWWAHVFAERGVSDPAPLLEEQA